MKRNNQFSTFTFFIFLNFILMCCTQNKPQAEITGTYNLIDQVVLSTYDSLLIERTNLDSLFTVAESQESKYDGLLIIGKKFLSANLYLKAQPQLPKGSMIQLINDSLINSRLLFEKFKSALSYYAEWSFNKSEERLDLKIIHSSSNDENDPIQFRYCKVLDSQYHRLVLIRKFTAPPPTKYYLAFYKKILNE